MSFKKHVNYGATSRGKRPAIRFKKGVGYLSIGFIEKASRVLREQGTLDPDEDVKYVELWFNAETSEVGVCPVGHRGLTDAIMMSRNGIRRISGTKNHVVSAVSYQREYHIPDDVKIPLEEKSVAIETKKGLQPGGETFIMFAGKIP